MNSQITANAVSGRATGALFFTGFGALWLVLALYAREQLKADSLALVLGGALALTGGALWLKTKARGLPRVEENCAVSRAFVPWPESSAAAFSPSAFLTAACLSPSLSSIATRRYETGQLAAQKLIGALNGGKPLQREQIDLGFELVPRESTALTQAGN